MMSEIPVLTESRVEQAVAAFHEGYNCSQAVFSTYADLFGIDRDTALRLSASFGGGMGRLRQVCGAVSGMFLLNGLLNGSTDPTDREAKKYNYERVQQLAAAFKEENGSIVCADLLAGCGLSADRYPDPSRRDEAYYRKRPCAELVRCCARLVEERLLEK